MATQSAQMRKRENRCTWEDDDKPKQKTLKEFFEEDSEEVK